MIFSSFFNILASTSFLLEPTMIFSFADKSYFAASSLLEQFCLSAENMNAEFWWQCHNSRRKSPGFIWWRREPIGCRQQSCIIFYVCFSLNYSRIYLCLFVSLYYYYYSVHPRVTVLMSTIRCVYVFSSARFEINVLLPHQFLSCSFLTPKENVAGKNLRFGQDFLLWGFPGALLVCQVQCLQWTMITVSQPGQTKGSATTCTQITAQCIY